MPCLKQFNPEIDQTTSATTIYKYLIPLVEHKAYTSNSRLGIVSAKVFVKGLNGEKYTRGEYMDSMQTVP